MEFQARLFTFFPTKKNLDKLENQKPDLNLSIDGEKLLFSSSNPKLKKIETSVYTKSIFNVKKNFSGLVKDFLQKGPQDKKNSAQRENSGVVMDNDPNELEIFLSGLKQNPEIRNKLLYLPSGINNSEDVLFLEGVMNAGEIDIQFLLILPEKLKEFSPQTSQNKFTLSVLKQEKVFSTDLEVEMLYGKKPNKYDISDERIKSLFPEISESERTIKIPSAGDSITIKKKMDINRNSTIKLGDKIPVKKSTLERSDNELVIRENIDLMLKVTPPNPGEVEQPNPGVDLKFPRQYLNLRNLGFLDMSGLGITSIPYDIDVLTNLKFLNLSNNNISKIPNSLTALVYKLIYLDLSKNKLEYKVPLSNGQTALLMPKDFKDVVEMRELEMIKEQKDVSALYFESYQATEGGMNLKRLRENLAEILSIASEEITDGILEDYIFKNIQKIEVTYTTGEGKKKKETSTIYKLDLRLENQTVHEEIEREPTVPNKKDISEKDLEDNLRRKKLVEQHFKSNYLQNKIKKHNEKIGKLGKLNVNPKEYINCYISYVSLLKEINNYNKALPGISDFDNFKGKMDSLKSAGLNDENIKIDANVIKLWFLFFQMNVISHLFTPELVKTQINPENVKEKIISIGDKLDQHPKLKKMYVVTLLKKDILSEKKKAQLDKIIEKYPFVAEITGSIDFRGINSKLELENIKPPKELNSDIRLDDLLEYHTLVFKENEKKILNNEDIRHNEVKMLEIFLSDCLNLDDSKKDINIPQLAMFDGVTQLEINIKNILLMIDKINSLNIEFLSKDPSINLKKILVKLLREKYKSLNHIFEQKPKYISKSANKSEDIVSEILNLFKSTSQKTKVEEVDDIEHYANLDRMIAMQTNNRDTFNQTEYGKVLALLDYIKAKKIEWFLKHRDIIGGINNSPITKQLLEKYSLLPEINFIRNIGKYISKLDFDKINLVLQEIVEQKSDVRDIDIDELIYLFNLRPPLTVYQKIINYNNAIDRFKLGANHKIKKLPDNLKNKTNISVLTAEKVKPFQIEKEPQEKIILRQIRRNARLFLGNEVDMTILDSLDLKDLNSRLTSILQIKNLYLSKDKYEFKNKEEILKMLKEKIREIIGKSEA